jgi:hypothetical protein
MTDDPIRTRRETAEIMRVSMRTLSRLEAEGNVPARTRLSERIFGYWTVPSGHISMPGQTGSRMTQFADRRMYPATNVGPCTAPTSERAVCCLVVAVPESK